MRSTAHLADFRHPGANQHPGGGDQHDFAFRLNQRCRHHPAIAFGRLNRNHALGAAAVTRVLGDRSTLAVAVFGCRQHRLQFAFGHQQSNHLLPFFELHAAHAACLAAHRTHVVFVETHRFARIGEQHHVMLTVGNSRTDEEIAFIETDRNNTFTQGAAESLQRGLFDGAQRSRHKHVFVGRELAHRQHHGDFFTVDQREHIDDRAAARITRTLRHFIDLDPVHAAAIGETQDVIVRIGDEQGFDPVVFFHRQRLLAASTAFLRAIFRQRLRLHVARVRHGDHHVLRGDQVFGIEFGRIHFDARTACIAEFFLDHGQFFADDDLDPFRTRQNVQQICDLRHHFAVFRNDLVLLQTGQTLQTHLQNFLGLGIGQTVQTIALHAEQFVQAIRTVGRTPTQSIDFSAREHIAHQLCVPRTRHQFGLGDRRRRRGFDQGDKFVDIGQCDGQAFEHMTAFARLAQLVHGTPRNDFAAVRQETFEHLLEIQQARLAVDQGHHIHAEGVLQLRTLVQVVEDHFRHFAALQLDHDPHPTLVGFVAQVGNAFDLLFVDQLGDPLQQRTFVHLVGQLVDDDGLALTAIDILEMGRRAHDQATATGAIPVAHTRHAIDDAGRGEIGSRDDLDQVVDGRFRMAQQILAAIDHFVQVVRRNIRRHPDRNTRRAVDQQVGHASRQNQRLVFVTVVVRPEIDRFLVDVGEQLMADLGHADFGVTHGSRVVTVHRAEIALAVNQHITQRKTLRHAHDGVVNRGIAVRVILTDHVTDDTRRLLIGTIPVVIQLMHRKQYTPVHWLETVTHIWKRTSNNHAHGVIEVGTAHFLL